MPAWTPDLVADRLIAAYRRVTGPSAIRAIDGRCRATRDVVDQPEQDLPGNDAEALVAAFRWPELFLPDTRDRRYLRTWASCRASGASVREILRDLDWPRSTAERRRLAALATIARKLNAGAAPTGA